MVLKAQPKNWSAKALAQPDPPLKQGRLSASKSHPCKFRLAMVFDLNYKRRFTCLGQVGFNVVRDNDDDDNDNGMVIQITRSACLSGGCGLKTVGSGIASLGGYRFKS